MISTENITRRAKTNAIANPGFMGNIRTFHVLVLKNQ
jgi:hypothetical protein